MLAFTCLSVDVVARLQLPSEARSCLLSVGVPNEVVLRRWAGPTLFSPMMQNGELGLLSATRSRPPEQMLDGYVVGGIRELASGAAPVVYSYFVLRLGDGLVTLVDSEHFGDRVLFVNSTYERFVRSLDIFAVRWERVVNGDEHAFRALRDELREIDWSAWASADAYWPTWFEELDG